MEDPIVAVLSGGPRDLPLTRRMRFTMPADSRVKLEHLGGYEQFERDHEARGLAVFRWVRRTRIAE